MNKFERQVGTEKALASFREPRCEVLSTDTRCGALYLGADGQLVRRAFQFALDPRNAPWTLCGALLCVIGALAVRNLAYQALGHPTRGLYPWGNAFVVLAGGSALVLASLAPRLGHTMKMLVQGPGAVIAVLLLVIAVFIGKRLKR